MPALRHWILAAAVAFAVLALTPAPATAQSPTDPSPTAPVAGAGGRPSDRPRPAKPRAPVNANVADKKTPPGTDPRQVKPAEAFPPERVQTSPPARNPDASAADAGLPNDPRGVEERKDPEP